MKQKFVLIAAIVFGLAAALLTRSWIAGKEAEYRRQREALLGKAVRTEVLVAARSLPGGTVLQAEDLLRAKVFEFQVLGRAVVTPTEGAGILGRRLERPVEKGAPLFWSDIENGLAGYKGLAHDIRPRMRAVSIAVSGANAVSGMIRPNDTVDVLGTFVLGASDAPGADDLVTLTMLQNVTVLATGSDTAKTIDPSPHASGGYSTVTLEVTPREAELLVFAQQMRGRLSLTLRSPTDVDYEKDLPRIDFKAVEASLVDLNEYRQNSIRNRAR